MPDDKKISITGGLDVSPTPGFQDTLKKASAAVARANNFQGQLKELDKVIKKHKEFGKTLTDYTNKALKEKDTLLERINKKTERSIKLTTDQMRQEKMATYLAQREYRRYGGSIEGAVRYASEHGSIADRAAQYRSGIQQSALGNVMTGQAFADSQAMAGEQERNQQRQNSLFKAGVWMQAAGQVASTVGDMFQLPMQKLGNTVAQRQFAGNLYNELSSGDVSSLFAMMSSGRDMQDLISQAKLARGFKMAGGTITGVGRGIMGGAMAIGGAAAGGATGGISSVATAYGIQNATAGFGQAINSGAGFFTGEIGAAASQAAQQALDYYKNLNPVARRQFNEMASRLGMFSDLGMMAGGTGSAAWRSLTGASVAGGLTDQEGMGYFTALRGGIGQTGAERYLGTVTQSMMRYGMDRGTAVSALTNLTSMSPGNAEGRLEALLSRAFKAGLKDTAVQGALATSLPHLLGGVGGRAGDVGHAAGLISAAAVNLGGGTATMSSLGLATQAYSLSGTMAGTGGPVQALNVAQSASIFRVGAQFGLSRETQLALVTVASQNPNQLREAGPDSPIWKMLERDGVNPRAVLSQIANGQASTFNQFFGDFKNPYARNIIGAGVLGGTAETFGAGVKMLNTPFAGGGDDFFRLSVGTEQANLNKALIGRAGLQTAPAEQALNALGGEGSAKLISNLMLAGNVISNALSEISMTNPDKLGDVPAIIRGVGDAIAYAGDQAAKALGKLAPFGGNKPVAPTEQESVGPAGLPAPVEPPSGYGTD